MKKRRSRYQQGNVFLDRRRGIWYFKWYEGGTRRTKRLGTTKEIPTITDAKLKSDPHRPKPNTTVVEKQGTSFETAARRYMTERMPHRHSTSNGYRNNLEKHVLPQWGNLELSAVKPLAVDRWFFKLPLAPKTKAHIKSVMRQVFEYAQLCELIELQRNPMDLVRVLGGTIREREPRILTHDEWQRLLQFLIKQPMRTMVIVAFCLGLRRSELAGLKWSDFDWIKREVLIQRGVIGNRVDAVKTRCSKSRLPLDPSLVACSRTGTRSPSSRQSQTGCGHRRLLAERCLITPMPYNVTTLSQQQSWLGSGGWAGTIFGIPTAPGWGRTKPR